MVPLPPEHETVLRSREALGLQGCSERERAMRAKERTRKGLDGQCVPSTNLPPLIDGRSDHAVQEQDNKMSRVARVAG